MCCSTLQSNAIPNAILTNTGARALGKACLNIVLALEKPNDWAACTNSNDLILKSSALVKRAIPVQLVIPIITITIQILLSTTAVIVIISRSLGIEFNNSIPLETKVSIGTKVSSCNFLNFIKRLISLKIVIERTKTPILITNSIGTVEGIN